MNWQAMIIIAVCAVLLGGYSLFNKSEDDLLPSASTPLPPGYYMKNAAIIETGTDGNPRLQLHADNIQQDSSEQNVQLQDIALNYISNSGTPWLLTAQRANLEQSTRVVTFNGEVELQPQGSRVATPVTLRTDQLSIDTEHNVAVAPGQVSILMNRQIITAVGLQADLQRQTISLLSKVHGEFTSR